MISHMLREIRSQGDAWSAAIDAVDAAGPELADALAGAAPATLMLGAGSSYYLGVAARGAWVRRGRDAMAVPASEALLHPELYPVTRGGLALGISRSGTTTETLRALAAMRAGGALAVGITTVAHTPITDAADHALVIHGAAEDSTVQTRSFSAQLLTVLSLAALAGRDEPARASLRRLPQLAPAWIERSEEAVEPLAMAPERIYVLGTGDRWGLAMEGALKLKETSLTEAEAFQTLEFRHGPQSMVDENTLVVGLLGNDPTHAEAAVLREMVHLGARVLAVSDEPLDAAAVPGATMLTIGSDLPEEARLPLYLPPLQLLAHHRGVGKGLDPDHPRNLRFAIELERI
jgi:glucosamine--fructose-6-phosphate aminotransferase (isomerizing)